MIHPPREAFKVRAEWLVLYSFQCSLNNAEWESSIAVHPEYNTLNLRHNTQVGRALGFERPSPC